MADEASLEQVRAELGAMLSNLEELLPDQPGAPIMAREYRPLIVLPRLEEISVDANVLLFGLAVSPAVGLLLGLLPAWHPSAVAASGHMTAGACGATGGRDRQLVRRGLVVMQIRLALTLLVGSGLAVRSFQRLAVVDPGLDPVDVLTFALALPPRDYDTPDSRSSFYRQVVDRLRALPGAVDAAASSMLPLDGRTEQWGGTASRAAAGRGRGAAGVRGAGRFARLLRRDADRSCRRGVFDRLDEDRDVPVAIVSRSLARAQWPGESELGEKIRMGAPPEAEGEAWSRIVGVVDDVHETALHGEPQEWRTTRCPAQASSRTARVLCGTWCARRTRRRSPARCARRCGGSTPRCRCSAWRRWTRVARARGTQAFVMVLLVVAAALAPLLGAVGRYGIVSYTVAQRRHEMPSAWWSGCRWVTYAGWCSRRREDWRWLG